MRIGLIVGLIVLLVAGCNTVKGVGKDVQAGGEVIEDSVK